MQLQLNEDIRAEVFSRVYSLAYAFSGCFARFVYSCNNSLAVCFRAFSPWTESGAFGTLYAFVVTIVVYRSLTWESFKIAVINSVRTTSMVLILVACAAAFAYMLTYYQVPTRMIEFMNGVSDNPIVILLMINVMLLILGMIMDMAALILICTPIFLPVAIAIGIDPLQFGMILMMNLGLGLCTPPVGACLFVGCVVGDVPMEKAVKTIWPFYAAILIALMLTTFIPAMSLTLPNLIDS